MTTTEQLPTWDATDSADQALVTGAVAVEQGFVQTYERQRQLGMLAILAPAFLVISTLLILLFTSRRFSFRTCASLAQASPAIAAGRPFAASGGLSRRSDHIYSP